MGVVYTWSLHALEIHAREILGCVNRVFMSNSNQSSEDHSTGRNMYSKGHAQEILVGRKDPADSWISGHVF